MRLLTFMLLLVLFASCGNNAVPADIIAKEKMETIMWQLMQSDEYVNAVVIKDSSKKSSTERMKIYQQVFDLNKTTLADFKKSYHFYLSHPDITKVMFDSITARAGRQRTDMYQPKPDSISARKTMEHLQMEKRKSDSIAKAGVQHAKPDKLKADSLSLKRKKGFPPHKLKADTAITHLKKH